MSSHRGRITVLLTFVVIAGALVLVDRLRASTEDEHSAPTVRDEQARQAELTERMRRFIAAEPAWRAAHDKAEDAWRAIDARLIHAPTAELANARLQQMIGSIVTDLGVTLGSTSAPSVRTPGKDTSLRVIGLGFSVQAAAPEQLYAFIDRLENLPGAWTNITRLRVMGPRRTPSTGLRVELDLEALAWVDAEDRDAG